VTGRGAGGGGRELKGEGAPQCVCSGGRRGLPKPGAERPLAGTAQVRTCLWWGLDTQARSDAMILLGSSHASVSVCSVQPSSVLAFLVLMPKI